MRVVAALGGNALLRRGEAPDEETQLKHVQEAVRALVPIAEHHELVITHGNGPQVGLLALESSEDPTLSRPYPLDTLVAETQGMIGYWITRELRSALPRRQIVTLLTDTLVHADDPAFSHPTKFVGCGYPEVEAAELTASRGWTMRPDGDHWRRVVASPEPHDILELPAIHLLLAHQWIVIAAGGGGIPVTSTGHEGAEAVVDKDLTAALVAVRLQADALLLLTDVPGIVADYQTPYAHRIRRANPAQIRALRLPDGSMGPKAEAACRFVEQRPGALAAVGALTDAPELLTGNAGTQIRTTREAHHAHRHRWHL